MSVKTHREKFFVSQCFLNFLLDLFFLAPLQATPVKLYRFFFYYHNISFTSMHLLLDDSHQKKNFAHNTMTSVSTESRQRRPYDDLFNIFLIFSVCSVRGMLDKFSLYTLIRVFQGFYKSILLKDFTQKSMRDCRVREFTLIVPDIFIVLTDN